MTISILLVLAYSNLTLNICLTHSITLPVMKQKKKEVTKKELKLLIFSHFQGLSVSLGSPWSTILADIHSSRNLPSEDIWTVN